MSTTTMTPPSLPTYQTFDRRLESLPREELRALQSQRLRAMVAYVYATSPFWRAKVDASGMAPADFRTPEDLRRLPLTSRAELEADQLANPPFGSYICSPPEQWARFLTTSGTTGRKLRRVYSARDWELAVGRLARGRGDSRGKLSMSLGPIDGLTGPTMAVEATIRTGGVPVLAGLWNTEAKVTEMAALRPAVISGSTSYLIHLSEVAQKMGVDLSNVGIERVNASGEPGGAVESTRALLRERFGVTQIGDGYGMTELFPLGGTCAHSSAVHLAEDCVIVECVDPETGSPVAPGEVGELVYTNLIGDTHPVLRYRSRDLGRLSDGSPCACGSTFVRIERLEGRSDDMVTYHGSNFFPSAVEQVVRTFPGLSPEYRIVIDHRGSLPRLVVQVEAQGGVAGDDDLAAPLAEALRRAISVRPAVEVLAAGTLPRVEAGSGRTKTNRVVELREVEGSVAQ